MAESGVEVSPITIPGQQHDEGEPFPLALECRSAGADLEAVAAWVAARAGELVEAASRHGAVLFRGFPLRSADDFDRFVAAFGLESFAYEDSMSNAVRVNKTPRVFTANEAPPSVAIHFHHEMAQTPVSPSKLFFFCEEPAVEGGATPLCRSDVLWARLAASRPEFARDCAAKGLRYTHVMPPSDDPASGMGRSWRSTLKASTPAEAERRLGAMGYSWEWLDDGCLRATTPVLPAVRALPGGRTSFYNQLIAAYHGWKDTRNDPSKAITFGDGTPLDPEAVAEAAALAESLAFDIPWRRGDVALVDNYV
ncbi:MAG TPA: TauD/TfdA family dioxygenase, partial [Isosphaeraceae bacterium]